MLRTSSCCTETACSQLFPRSKPSASLSVPAGVPNVLLRGAPISVIWMLPAASITDPLRSRSVHVRVSDCAPSGLRLVVVPSAFAARNLPRENLRAVRPVPNRSYDAPALIDQSDQHGWQSAAG